MTSRSAAFNVHILVVDDDSEELRECAHARGIGLMEFADSGTLFLDEIVDLQLPLQAKLLRAIQERRIRRVGATREIPLDLRIVAAASHDPADLVAAGGFREELYYRLNVGRIELPPLRERGDDVTLLAAAGGDVTAAARKAAIPRGTLYRLLNRHGLPASDFRSRR